MRLYNNVRFPIDQPCPENVWRIDRGTLPLADAMHRTGIHVDVPHMDALTQELQDLRADTEKRIKHHVGARHMVNPASPLQVADLLFHKLKVQGSRPVRLTDTGAESTGADQLQVYEDAHPVVRLILDWRHLDKLEGTYTRKMAALARRDPESRVHTRFKLTTAATGRWASENPNLQNIPTRPRKGLDKNYGSEVRKGFTATPGWVLVGEDLSQIEMRVAAHYSGEPSMIEGYHTPGYDMHSATAFACGLCGEVPCDPEDPEHIKKHRLPAKTLGFGILFLMQAAGLQLSIVDAGGEYWEETRCEQLIEAFYGARPAIREWQELQFRRARQYGMVWTEMGRHRMIPQMRSVLGWQRREGEREAANHPIQGLAGDILKVVEAQVFDILMDYNRGLPEPRVRPLLQVHDELIFEARSEEVAADWVGLTKPVMEQAVPLKVPVNSSADIHYRWGCLK